jgi:hypothetical protein
MRAARRVGEDESFLLNVKRKIDEDAALLFLYAAFRTDKIYPNNSEKEKWE